MRRVTLILSDLYLPEEITHAAPQVARLPSLDWLLRFADVERIGDWRQWLMSEVGVEHRPIASLCAAGLAEPLADTAWLATPVQLEARLDHVRLVDRGLLRLPADEQSSWCSAFNEVFGPRYCLHAGGERAFLLTGLAPVEVGTVDPARLLGAEIGPALPGSRAPELRRLWAEIEMWLHGSALNAARERAGSRRLSALWLWGREPALPSAPRTTPEGCTFSGGDPLVRALSRLGGNSVRDLDGFAAPAMPPGHLVIERTPLTGDGNDAWPALESNWFAPLRAALSEGSIDLMELVANDRVFRIGKRAAWRFWRRRRAWLESLGA